MDQRPELFRSNVKPYSVLGVLKKSIDTLHKLRRDQSASPFRIKIPAPSKSPTFKKSLKITKISGSFTEATSINLSPGKSSKQSYRESKNNLVLSSSTQTQEPLKSAFLSQDKGMCSSTQTQEPLKAEFLNQDKEMSIERLSISKILNFNHYSDEKTICVEKKPDFIDKAKQEISNLNKGQLSLQQKISKMNENLDSFKATSEEDRKNMKILMEKLSSLEKLSEKQKEDKASLQIPVFVEKVVKLENNYSYLKGNHSENLKNFREEMKEVNHKILDLEKSGEVLKELVITLNKEPVTARKIPQSVDTFTETDGYVLEETILLQKLDPENVFNDLVQQKEELIRDKEKLENEYRSIPQSSKSMLNKRRKQTLELELSMNYSKLMAVNCKIKRFTN